MPKVSFFTIMDIYLMSSFVVLMLMLVHCAAIRWIMEHKILDAVTSRTMDVAMGVVLSVLWVGGHIWFFVRFYAIKKDQAIECGTLLDEVVTNHEGTGAF